MKVPTAAQVRDRSPHTIEMGMPGIVWMENAGHRVGNGIDGAPDPLLGIAG
jgi:hypothetical protein